jgi:methionyl-tRNA formyltransferase
MNFHMVPSIVFMGSPEFSLPVLRLLAQHYQVAGVVTQPDRPKGRGQTLTPPPVKVQSMELGLPVIQPRRLHEPVAMEQLQAWQPDLIVVAAFGQILKPEVLDLPRHGCINVHASLLPRWRGAAPIPAAILHSDVQTGVTIMRMDPGVDTGPILSQRAIPILPDDTSRILSERLAVLGAELLIETLPGYLAGQLVPLAQDETHATYAPMLKKEDGELDFTQPAVDLARRVRAFNPWPGAFTVWQRQILKIHHAHSITDQRILTPKPPPGAQVIHAGLPALVTSDGLLALDEVQPAGKKPMPGKAFLIGARSWGN